MIKGYVRYGKFYDTLEFGLMLNVGPYPKTCFDVVSFTTLADMCAKCGDIEATYCVFESMPKKNVESWDSINGIITMLMYCAFDDRQIDVSLINEKAADEKQLTV